MYPEEPLPLGDAKIGAARWVWIPNAALSRLPGWRGRRCNFILAELTRSGPDPSVNDPSERKATEPITKQSLMSDVPRHPWASKYSEHSSLVVDKDRWCSQAWLGWFVRERGTGSRQLDRCCANR